METKKAGLIGTCLLVVVIGVVGTVAFVKSRPTHENNATTSSLKAVEDFCQNTVYKETCVKSISSSTNSTNTTELINVGFQVTVKELRSAQEKSIALQKAATDPETAEAFKLCQRLLDDSIEDLDRSLERLNTFDKDDMMLLVDDVKTWLTGAATYQQTCLFAFEEINNNEAGEQMKQLLKVGKELTTDALGMVDQVTKIVETEDFPGSSRRLLWGSESNEENWWRRLAKVSFATPTNLRPDIVVAKDSKGNYVNSVTINDALSKVPPKRITPFIIYVKEGVYEEHVEVNKSMWNVMLIGDGPTKTIIRGNRCNFTNDVTRRSKTFDSGTLITEGKRFTAKDITIENTSGPEGKQAVAVRVTSDFSIFYNCHINGYQDTLYAHNYRQFYRDCTIRGTIDFIFGNARAVLQNCTVIARKPLLGEYCTVTAQGREEKPQKSATILQNCQIKPEDLTDKTYKTYLGRPWKEYARVVVLDSNIEGIDPEGWTRWLGDLYIKTCLYIEHGNTGAGANQAGRVKWPGIKNITDVAAEHFTPAKFFRGDYWIKPATWLPYDAGRMKKNA